MIKSLNLPRELIYMGKGENGYEKTSITDIAKAIGVAQGLCYRYFPSKEALFDSAIEQYADVLVAADEIATSVT